MFPSDRVGRGGCLVAALGVSMLAAPPGPAAADTFPAACSGTTGDAASLIAAIKKANDQAGADTVQLGNRCLYALTARNNYWYGPNGLPAIASDVTIDGNGSTIARSPFAQGFRLFFVGARATSQDTQNYISPGEGRLTLQDVTLAGGLARGGASNGGGGGAGMGGAIFSQGTVTIERSTLSGNAAIGGAANDTAVGTGGGGIGTDSAGTDGGGAGQLGPAGTAGGGSGSSPFGGGGAGLRGEVGDNGGAGGAGGGSQTGLGGTGGGSLTAGTTGAPGGDGSGGGGASYDTSATRDTGAGGAFGAGGHGAPAGADSEGSGGGGVGGGGGGGGSDTTAAGMADFRSGGGGGGFGGGGGRGGAQDGGGGQGGFGGGGGSAGTGGGVVNGTHPGGAGFGGGTGSGAAGGGGAGLGGAIFSMQGRLTITGSTLTGNSAIGGADDVTDHAKGIGGAVFNLSGSFLSVGSTFAGDAAAYDGTEIYDLVYDGVTTHTAQATLRDTIVDGAPSPFALVADDPLNTSSVPNMGTAAADVQQSDLVRSRAQHGSAQLTGSPLTSDPQLGSLKDNGGPTQTMAPAAGSPVIDAGAAFGLTTDQRGLPRPADVMTIPNVGDGSDIGAVEVQTAAVPTFGTATRVALALGSKRIPAKGPLPIVVTNLNPFQVTGRLSGQTASKVRVNHKKPRRIGIKAKAFTLTANGKATVKLVLPQTLRDLLKKTGKLKLTLSAAVRDPAGNARTVTKTVIPRRKK